MLNRRMFLKYTTAFSALSLAQLTSGCKGGLNKAQLTALAQAIANSAANLASILGASNVATKILQLSAQLIGDIQVWTPGSPTNDIIQVLADLEAAISLIPVDSKTQALIELALGTIQAIVALFPAAAPQIQARAKVRVVTIPNPPKTKEQYAARWNAIVDLNPKLKGAHIN